MKKNTTSALPTDFNVEDFGAWLTEREEERFASELEDRELVEDPENYAADLAGAY